MNIHMRNISDPHTTKTTSFTTTHKHKMIINQKNSQKNDKYQSWSKKSNQITQISRKKYLITECFYLPPVYQVLLVNYCSQFLDLQGPIKALLVLSPN